jgi:hypothetical protein
MNNIIISNCCLGTDIHRKLNNCEYNNPFIGTLILDDFQYLKLCKNIRNYMTDEFVLTNNILPSIYAEQTKNNRYNNSLISNNYPILTNETIEIDIHAIHENNHNIAQQKFCKRQKRFNDIINNENYKIYCVMTYTNMFLVHNNYIEFINDFLSNNGNDENIIYLFLGPKLNGITHNNYIITDHMSKNIDRRQDNVNIQIDFERESDILVKYINTNVL